MINKSIKNRHRYRSCRGMMSYGGKRGGEIIKNSIEIIMPEIISLDDSNRDRLLSTLYTIHNFTKTHSFITINFSRTAKVFSDGMLLLYAELCNIKNIYPSTKLRCKPSKNIKINHVFKQIRLFDLLHYNFRSSRKFEDVIFWRSCSGRGVIGKKFDLVLEQNEKMKTYLQEVNLFSGCTEATQNATVHAYIAKRKLSLVDHEKCSWWIFSQIKKNVLTVCVCDLGVGIARTLPQKYAFYDTILKQLPEKAGASELIKKAIEEPSSRTHEDHRGNGLKTIAQVAQNKDGASLKILSSKACVLVSKQGIFTHDYSNEVPGTIIAWTLPLGEDE